MTATRETDVEARPRGRDRLPLDVAAFALVALAGAALIVWLATRPKLDGETRRRMLTDLAAWDAAAPGQRLLAAQWVAAREPAFALSRLERFSCGGQSHEVAVFRHAATGLEFSLVPGGTFLMGSPEDEPERDSDETQHKVTLTRPFLIARTECTQAAYERVVGTNPSEFMGPSRPVEHVSWDDAKAFCDRVGLVLPTEAQWERACRAGTTGRFCAADSEAPISDFGWLDEDGSGPTHDVAAKQPNSLGLFDVHGNVQEWSADCYGDYAIDPTGGPASDARVIRGGSFGCPAGRARSAVRGVYTHVGRVNHVGFRPARDVQTE